MAISDWSAIVTIAVTLLGSIFAIYKLGGRVMGLILSAASEQIREYRADVAHIRAEMARMNREHTAEREVWKEERATLLQAQIELASGLSSAQREIRDLTLDAQRKDRQLLVRDNQIRALQDSEAQLRHELAELGVVMREKDTLIESLMRRIQKGESCHGAV
jgi:predicted  nucleic acid-binding Zn-ribbon protein